MSIGSDGRFPEEINERFPAMMRTVWLCWLSMAVVAILLIHSGEANEDGLWEIVAAKFSPQHSNSASALREDRLRNLELEIDYDSASRPLETKYTPLT